MTERTSLRLSPAVLAATLAVLGLAAYGIKSWYFPAPATWWLVAPLAIGGIALALRINARMDSHYPTRGLKLNARICTLVLVPLLVCAAFAMGVPALALRVMGPDARMAATVVDKDERFRRCRRRIHLAEYSRPLCVSGGEFAGLREGQAVLVHARVGVLGTFLYSLEPAGADAQGLADREPAKREAGDSSKSLVK